MNCLDMVQDAGVALKKMANNATKGAEYQGQCPWCGGKDRFHVWPDLNDGRGAYWCRPGAGHCGRYGDNIQFARDYLKKTYREACVYSGMSDPGPPARKPRPAYRPLVDPTVGAIHEPPLHDPASQAAAYKPVDYPPPPELWQVKAGGFTAWAYENIKKSPDALAWLAARGIDAVAVDRFHLGWNPEDLYRPRPAWGLEEVQKDDGKNARLWLPEGIVIPYIQAGRVVRVRIRRPDEAAARFGPKYYLIPGSSVATTVFMGANHDQCRSSAVVESELDAMMLAALAGDILTAVSVGSLSSRPDRYADEVLSASKEILLAFDADPPASSASVQGDKVVEWWRGRYQDRCGRVLPPAGKDPGEAFAQGVDIRAWLLSALSPAVRLFAGKTAPTTTAHAPRTPREVKELLGLIAAGPVRVVKYSDASGSGIRVDAPREWERTHSDESARISELVFGSPTVQAWLVCDAREVISSWNI